MPTKILLDTDPGGDDSFALLWLQGLAHQGHAEIVAVTTADGNVPAQLTFAAACQLLQLGGHSQVEVGRAVSGSVGKLENASAIHGADGMGNLSQTLPQPHQDYKTARSADVILSEQLQAAPGEITLVAIGPLTNLAAAERQSPGLLKLARQVVVMGGAFLRAGNVTPEAEFNIAYDPEAAQQVFQAGANLVVIPLDVTHQLIFTPAHAQQINAANPDRPIALFIVALTEFMVGTALKFRETQGEQGFLVHDAATLAYLFYPETLLFQSMQVEIETQGKSTCGKTVFDRRHQAKSGANAWVAMAVDAEVLLAVLVADLKELVRQS
jgi:inosine-uridine nucleoside N-ribohydrolase